MQKSELKTELSHNRGFLLSVGLFSAFVNILMLTGPIFAPQVYDRVLGSGSEETLAALFLLVTALYMIMGLFDYIRGRISARVGASFQVGLDNRTPISGIIYGYTWALCALSSRRQRPCYQFHHKIHRSPWQYIIKPFSGYFNRTYRESWPPSLWYALIKTQETSIDDVWGNEHNVYFFREL